ncbi:MAG: ABC transporter substrate-binding protein [Propionibacteriaceae bacterium]|nr:ABC transporter substrate-binding protein [Propionibacteriaceae bacterium]
MRAGAARRLAQVVVLLQVLVLAVVGCAPAAPADPGGLGNGWAPESSLELRYAQNFSVDYYAGGLALITTSDQDRFLVVPPDQEAPTGLADGIVVLRQPIERIYLAATAVMSLFIALDALDAIGFSAVQADGWYLPQAKAAMEAGRIAYGGKYSAPDYELILSQTPGLAIESMMISHSPQVKEKLESVGIPVLVDRSSYEPHPLGRTEWIKLYGVLTGQSERAAQVFDQQAAYLDSLAGQPASGQTVAFFHISSAGYVVTRRSGDYVPKIIELAGGRYIFSNLGDSDQATSSVNLEMEQFYSQANQADHIIYNATIAGQLSSLEDLVALNPLLADFKAVQTGQVWVTDQDFYQDMTGLGQLIDDVHQMLTADDPAPDQLHYLHRLRWADAGP